MRGKTFYLIVLAALLVAILACVPKAAPVISPTPLAPQASPALPITAIPTLTAEEAAWEKVVAAAKREGVVTIYTASFVADIGGRISRDFQSQYGIRVEIMPGGGAPLLEKVKVEQAMKRQVGDIFNIGGTGSTTDLVVKGGAESIASELPAIRDKQVFKTNPVYSPGGESLAWLLTYIGVLINSNLVKPEDEPKSYKDLLLPRWKGKILSPDPRGTGGGTPVYYTLRYHKVLDLDYYRRLAEQDIKEWGANVREGYRMVARGEFPVMVLSGADTAAPIMAEGAPLKLLAMEEGVVSNFGTIVVAKGAPHPNAARVFINWLMSPQGQLAYAESAGGTSIRKDVPDFLPPGARLSPKRLWPATWDSQEWAIKDQAAGTMAQIFGRR